MTAASSVKPKSTKQAVLVVLLLAIIIGSAATIWWYRPANAERRYGRMSLVSLKQFLDANPNNAVAWRQFSLRLASQGDAALAEPALTKALELNPNDPDLATGLAELWMAKSRYPEAFELLKMTLASHPNSVEANRALARLYLTRGSYQRAYDAFEIVARADKNADDARYQQAVCSMAMNNPAAAREDIKKALALQPNNPAYIALEGSADAAIGNVADGISELQRAAVLAPKDIAIQVALVNLLLAQHRNAADLTAAEESIARLEQLSPDYPPIPVLRAKLDMLKHNWQSAVRYFEFALKTSPQMDEIYIGLSQAYTELGKTSEAAKMVAEYHHRQDLRRRVQRIGMALSANPRDMEAYGTIAALEMQLGNQRSAAEAIRRGLQVDPANSKLQAMQTALEQTSPPK